MTHISVLKYLWSDAVLSACHLINRMSSFVLGGKKKFSCLYPNKSAFSMTPHIFVIRVLIKTCLLSQINFLLHLSSVFLLDILELKKDIDVITLPPVNILCLQMSYFLSLFHISLHRILLLPLKLFLFHNLCHCMHRLLLILRMYHPCFKYRPSRPRYRLISPFCLLPIRYGKIVRHIVCSKKKADI